MELYEILPTLIRDLASGFAFLLGFYFISDTRFDFFSDVNFSVMLVVGFACVNLIDLLCKKSSILYFSVPVNNILIFGLSFICGFILAYLKNTFGVRMSRFIIRHGRRKSATNNFWYDRLDKKDKPFWLRLVSYEYNYILQGVLLSIDEKHENPYLLLGYCRKFDLNGALIDRQYYKDEAQCIVKADDFQEIYLLYDKNSDLLIRLDLLEKNSLELDKTEKVNV